MSGLRRLFKFRRNSGDCSDSDQVLPVKNSETENGLMSPALKIQKSDGDVLVLSDKEERLREKMVERLVSKRGKKRIRTSAGIRGNGRRLQVGWDELCEQNFSFQKQDFQSDQVLENKKIQGSPQ